MDMDKDWKKKVGFPINYESGPSSEDDFDSKGVVMRHPQSSRFLLDDKGDGAEADLLGTTPPRARIRGKLRRKTYMDASPFRDSSRRSSEEIRAAAVPEKTDAPDRLKKRFSLKMLRTRERDWKKEGGQREHRADSLPSPNPAPAVPTLVESCSRFMSLTSRLKCKEATFPAAAPEREAGAEERRCLVEAPPSRVNFHKTFSMLINMGSIEKGCKRTISREEQVWQNEFKDLIWLELQAKIAGRSLAQQDAFLCAQRNIVPTIVQNIRNYRFVNKNPCRGRSSRLRVIAGSREDLAADEPPDGDPGADDDGGQVGCLSFNCAQCTDAIGAAMREVGTLLDSYYNATTLYPSSKAMTQEHPLVATQLFKNRLKAMCLWYNTSLHLRLKVLSVRRMLRTMKLKSHRRGLDHLASTDSDVSRQSDCPRPCTVRFDVSNTPSDSNNSDSSAHSELNKEETDGQKGDAEEQADEKDGQDNGDEVDHAVEVKYEQNGQTTPEIVISDSKYGTSDTTTSNESGYSTSRADSETRQRQIEDVFDVGSLQELTNLRLLGKCEVSPYRIYHREMLKTQGVRRCMMFMDKMRLNVLHKVYLTLEKPDAVKSETFTDADSVEVFDDTKEEEENSKKQDEDALKTYELRRYGCWSEESLAMRLPSYRNHILLLSSICMEAVHDFLSLRLEDRPQNPSCLTVKQLIHELKEGLDIATEMREAFLRYIEVALVGHKAGASARQDLLLLIGTYDDTVETVMKQYLSYLVTMSEVEHMPRSCLRAEWTFTARIAKRIKCAALLAPVTFSEIACNQIGRLLQQFDNKFKELSIIEQSGSDDRHVIYALCREAQCIYASDREATLQAAQWARALAGRLARAPPPAYRTQRAAIFESLMSIRDCIVKHTQLILERSRVPPEEVTREFDGVVARVRELLLQVYKLGFELHKELYKFAQAPFELLGEKSLKRHRPASLQPTRAQTIDFSRKRPETMLIHESFNPMIHKELHRFVNDSSAPRQPTFGCPLRAAGPFKAGRPKFMRSESIGEDAETNVFDDKLFENINNFADNQTQSSIELLLGGREDERAQALAEEVELRPAAGDISEEEKQWAMRVARAVVQFARCWMQFVVERCDTGRGLRPRWASQGLEFLMLACDPCNTKHLSDEEFEELKKEMDSCISHVIGCRPAAPRAQECGATSPHPRSRPRMQQGSLSSSGGGGSTAGREPRDAPTPPTPPTEPDPLLSFHGLEPAAYSRRVVVALKQLDSARDEKLREMRAVGRVLEAAVACYEPKLRQLQFKWQRGLKIGAGTFGKVYTVVNTESGQLLAMKELSIGVGDRRALQRAANELRVLEGVVHPHLVRYYGCELHREEMLLFMELCVEGSLEALVATSGALTEHTVRRYTKQLLSAVIELHTRSIVHRDIKSGNIFLTNEGHCLKLGDFGCAVKIRANTTAAGELLGHVGTQAYMAPEVFMKSSGHGRSADIWSLGCVVTEMASGKRPFSEYDSNYQIMFVVGMGGRPLVPDTLSEEGRQFCMSCLTHEPEQRPRAEALSTHHFLMVKSDDDCNCEPAYLITQPAHAQR